MRNANHVSSLFRIIFSINKSLKLSFLIFGFSFFSTSDLYMLYNDMFTTFLAVKANRIVKVTET